jgi:malonyl-CoA O-methyltransferase
MPRPPPKQRVRESFERAAVSYDGAAVLQRQVCDHLLADPRSLSRAGKHPRRRLRHRLRRPPAARALAAAQITAVDFAPAMLALARADADLCFAADIEALPCRRRQFRHLVVKPDRPVVRRRQGFCRGTARPSPGGQLALSTLGPETFHELREAFTGIDRHRHTLSFSEPAAIHAALARAGFVHIRAAAPDDQPALP